MANAADKIQANLSSLAEQTATLQNQVNETFEKTGETLSEHLGGVQTGLASLSGVLTQLGQQQVVIQQVPVQTSTNDQPSKGEPPAKRGWFGRNTKSSRRNGRKV